MRKIRRDKLYTYKYRDKETSQHSSKQLSSLFDSALILGILTGTGYYLAFSYQKGYKNYYHIDTILLDDIAILNVLIAMGALVVTSLFFLYVFQGLYSFTSNSNHPFMQYFRESVLPFIFICIILIFLSPEKSKNWALITGGFLVVLPFIALLIAAIFQDGKGYLNKLKLAAVSDEPTLFEKVRILINNGNTYIIIVFPILIVYLLSTAATMLGEKDASEKELYMIIDGEPPLVIIDKYEEGMILAPIGLKTKLLTPEFQVIETKSTIKSPVKFKTMKFEGGIEVKEPTLPR